MAILVLGASGATGKQLVQQLLKMGQKVKVIVRPTTVVSDGWINEEQLSIIKANISEITEDEMFRYLEDCHCVASCLGHNISFKGIYGKPRRLVTNAVKLVCKAIQQHSREEPIRLVLMNTVAVRNMDLNESFAIGEKLVMRLIRMLLPPQVDNEQAAAFLRVDIGPQNKQIEWVAVRPDTLFNEDIVTDYEVFPSPVRSALFDAGKTSRINVGNFMARLITEEDLWKKWKGQMPVVYNVLL